MVATATVMRRTMVLAGLLVLVVGCERAKTVAPGTATSSPGISAHAIGAGAAATMKTWDDEIGAIIATPSLDGGAPVLFERDTTSGADVETELFNHDDHTSKAILHPGAAIRSCAWRRSATITGADGRATPNSWALALSPGVARPVGIESVGELLPRDSAAMVARISRLVSAMPEDSGSAPFLGVPVVVRDAWLFQLPDSTTITVAIAMRSLNVESNPLAQAITLIAEPDHASPSTPWRTAFYERDAGPEDRIEGIDLLAAFLLDGRRPAVALVREGDSGLQLEVVERTAPGVWAVRWSSAALPCAPR